MSRMLVSSLRAAWERGDALSILIAAEWPIYGRFGYAPATLSRRLRPVSLPSRPRSTSAASGSGSCCSRARQKSARPARSRGSTSCSRSRWRPGTRPGSEPHRTEWRSMLLAQLPVPRLGAWRALAVSVSPLPGLPSSRARSALPRSGRHGAFLLGLPEAAEVADRASERTRLDHAKPSSAPGRLSPVACLLIGSAFSYNRGPSSPGSARMANNGGPACTDAESEPRRIKCGSRVYEIDSRRSKRERGTMG